MSSKVTGDAQPDGNIPTETDQTLPTEIVGNLTVAEAPAGTGNPGTGNGRPAESRMAPELAAESATGEPAEVTERADPAESAAPPAAESPAEVQPEGETGTSAETPADAESPADADVEPAEAENETENDAENEAEAENFGELENPDEPTELIAQIELVELAEPVEGLAPRRRVHGVLIAFVFVLAAAAIVGGAIAIVGSLTHGFKKPVVVHYKKSAIFSLKTGQCIDPNGQQAATIVNCNSPHDAEVFATFSLSGSKWPGTKAASAAASAGCSTRLTGYLNPQLAISLSSTYIYPGKVAWEAGTRTVICEVQAASGQLTGSVRGASATAH